MHLQLNITKPLYREYLRFLFPLQPDGTFKVTRENDLGKFICCFVRYSERPVPVEQGPATVTVLLPETHVLDTAPSRYLWLSREESLRINDLLEVIFNIDLDSYYLKGIKSGLQQKEVIESFIVSRKLTNLLSDNETIKKRIYRDELNTFRQRTEMLRQKIAYRSRRMKFDPEKYLVI